MTGKSDDAANTFVLLHGAYHTAQCWERLVPHLNEPAIAVDLPGRGSRPMNLPKVTFSSWIDAVIEAIDQAATPNVTLVGHSLGGILLPAAANFRPDRVAQLVFLAGMVPPEGGTQRANLSVVGRIGAKMTTRRGVMSPPPRWLARAMFCNTMSRALADRTVSLLVPEAAAVFHEPIPRYGPVKVPALYIRLRRDRAVSRRVALRQMSNYGGKIRTVELDAGHDAMISHPESVAAILNHPESRMG